MDPPMERSSGRSGSTALRFSPAALARLEKNHGRIAGLAGNPPENGDSKKIMRKSESKWRFT